MKPAANMGQPWQEGPMDASKALKPAQFAAEQMHWEDPDRPAGSEYSQDEWLQAEAQNPGYSILEVCKPKQRSLVAKSGDAMDVVLHRSLVIDRRVDSPWHAHATVHVEHYGEFGVNRYSVVRSINQAAKAPWADGSKMVMRDAGYEEPSPAQTRSRNGAAPSSLGERFRG